MSYKHTKESARAILAALAAGESVNGVTVARFQPPKAPRILGSSVKVEKGRSMGILSAVAYLAPAYSGGIKVGGKAFNACPSATKGCRAGCLGEHSGRLAMGASANSRRWKLALYLAAPDIFRALVEREIAALERNAKRLGTVAAVRMDGATDLGIAQALALPASFPNVRFYDYTKVGARIEAWEPSANYHLSYSANEGRDSQRLAALAIEKGLSVAAIVPAGTEPNPIALARAVMGRYRFESSGTRLAYIVNGDDSDARFLDPPGSIVWLGVKGGKRIARRLGGMVFQV